MRGLSLGSSHIAPRLCAYQTPLFFSSSLFIARHWFRMSWALPWRPKLVAVCQSSANRSTPGLCSFVALKHVKEAF
jgi:hypothetical protein